MFDNIQKIMYSRLKNKFKVDDYQESALSKPDVYGYGLYEDRQKQQNVPRLVQLRELALQEPMFMKGIYKKYKHVFRQPPKIVKKDGSDLSTDIQAIIDDFNKSTNIMYKMKIGGISSSIWGNGFIERTFSNDFDDNRNIKKNVSLKEPSGVPVGLNLVNPEFINTFGPRKYSVVDKQNYYHFRDNKGNNTYIHPKRLLHIKTKELPFSKFGISDVDVSFRIIDSKLRADKALGDILAWFGRGMLFITKEGLRGSEKTEMEKDLKKHPSFMIGNERYKFDVKNPTQINPKWYTEYFIENIAAAIEMPTSILLGNESSTGEVVVGAEDYYNDIQNIQDVVFTPIFEDVYKQLLQSHGHTWRYEIRWPTVFVDELSEAKALEKRMLVATTGYNSKLVTRDEGRKIINEGTISLDVKQPDGDFKEDSDNPGMPSKPTPNLEPVPPSKKPVPEASQDKVGDIMSKKKEEWMSKSLMTEEEFKAFQEKGRKELAEQEKRIQEGKNKYNVGFNLSFDNRDESDEK